jgi:hypothetical protein
LSTQTLFKYKNLLSLQGCLLLADF